MSLVPLFLLGGLTGILSGYLGLGGGIIVVPVLTEIFLHRGLNLDRTMTATFATSLFQAMFTTGSSAWKQWRQDNILKRAVPGAALGAIIGGQLGAYLGSCLTGGALIIMFGCFLLFAAFNLARTPGKSHDRADISYPWTGLSALGAATGIISALLGVGGGILMVPAFILLFKYPAAKVAGTSSAIGFLTTISGVVGYLLYGAARAGNTAGFVGVIDLSVAAPIALGAVLTAPIGARLNKEFGGLVYQRIFAVFLAFIAIRMLCKVM